MVFMNFSILTKHCCRAFWHVYIHSMYYVQGVQQKLLFPYKFLKVCLSLAGNNGLSLVLKKWPATSSLCGLCTSFAVEHQNGSSLVTLIITRPRERRQYIVKNYIFSTPCITKLQDGNCKKIIL